MPRITGIQQNYSRVRINTQLVKVTIQISISMGFIVFSFETRVTFVMFGPGFFLAADMPFFFLLFGIRSDFPSKYLPFYLIYHDFFCNTSWHHLSFSKFFPGEFRLTDTFLKTKLHILSLYILCILCYKNKRHFEGA